MVRNLLIVDDSDIFRRSLRIIVEASAEWTICGEASSAEDGARFASQLAPDAIVMDISMRGMSGIEALQHIRSKLPESKIVIVSFHDSTRLAEDILQAGACGYVVKPNADSDLIEALDAVMNGKIYVSRSVTKARATRA